MSRSFGIAALLACAVAATAQAQTFPWKTVRLVSGVSPGSASDTMARVISERLQTNVGQPVIVENRIGGGGIVGAGSVAKADPDGHTISVYTSSFTMVPFRPHPPFDAPRDLAAVATLATIPNVLIVSPAKGWNTGAPSAPVRGNMSISASPQDTITPWPLCLAGLF